MSVDVVSQLWPPALASTRVASTRLPRQVWGAPTALSIPGVGKILHLYRLAALLRMEAWRGPRPVPAPRLVRQPDPNMPGSSWFVGQHVEDWLIDGNALHLVTVRSAVDGAPLAVQWFPARMWHIETRDGVVVDRYWLNGRPIPRNEDVVHVRRGSDPFMPCRGWGLVEQHLGTFDRVAMADAAERENAANGGVPSVAVILPQTDPRQADIDQLAVDWGDTFSGPGRVPGFFPKGTEIKPLSWSPNDSQAAQARQASLVDLANLAGIDPYWLGAPTSSHTYRTAGGEWLKMVRTTLNAVLKPLEETWGAAWLPRGTDLRFNRDELTRGELADQIDAMDRAVRAGLYSRSEARTYLGMDPDSLPDQPAPTEAPPAPQTNA